jgi:hypothetical protein
MERRRRHVDDVLRAAAVGVVTLEAVVDVVPAVADGIAVIVSAALRKDLAVVSAETQYTRRAPVRADHGLGRLTLAAAVSVMVVVVIVTMPAVVSAVVTADQVVIGVGQLGDARRSHVRSSGSAGRRHTDRR